MQESLRYHHTSISIGGRPTRNLRFADDIDLVVGNNGKPQNLIDRLVDRATAYGMEVSTEKSMNGQKLEEVTSFKYMGVTLCKAEVRIRIASAVAAMTRLNKIWRCNTISFASQFKCYNSIITNMYPAC